MMYDDTIAEILYARTCDTAENAKMIRGIICQNSVTNVGSTLKKVRQMFIRCQKNRDWTVQRFRKWYRENVCPVNSFWKLCVNI